VQQAKSHQFLRVKNSANSGLFSCEDCEKDLLDEILRTEMFTYISKSEIRYIAPFWVLDLVTAMGFFGVRAADALEFFLFESDGTGS
jgi:hypothetical protein